MATWNVHLVFAALMVFTLLGTGSCLKCYNCTSESNPHCVDPIKKDNPQVSNIDCPGGNVCVKTISPSIILNPDGSPKTNLPPKVIRGCNSQNFCSDHVKDFKTHCSTCTTELCNSASMAAPSFILISLYVVKFLVNY